MNEAPSGIIVLKSGYKFNPDNPTEVRSIKSQKWYYCGPAVLQWALGVCHIRRAQDTLARRCRTTRATGTSNSRLVEVMREFDLGVRVSEEAPWSLLTSFVKTGYVVVVGWHSDFREPTGPHFSGVLAVTPHVITLMDPEIGGPRPMTRREFEKRWHDYDSAEERRLNRWLAAIVRAGDTREFHVR